MNGSSNDEVSGTKTASSISASPTLNHRKEPNMPEMHMMIMRAVNHLDEEAPEGIGGERVIGQRIHCSSPRGATKALILFTAKSFLHLVPLLTTKKRLCLTSTSTACGCNASLSLINLWITEKLEEMNYRR